MSSLAVAMTDVGGLVDHSIADGERKNKDSSTYTNNVADELLAVGSADPSGAGSLEIDSLVGL